MIRGRDTDTDKYQPHRDNSSRSPLQFFIGLSFSLVFLFFLTYLMSPLIATSNSIPTYEDKDNTLALLPTKQKKIALLWTPYYQKQPNSLEKTHFCARNCTLKVTSSRDYFEFAEAILFHSPDIVWDRLPPKVVAGQSWVLYSQESPAFDEPLRNQSKINKFDVMMRYRLEATIPVPFGRDIELPGGEPVPLQMKSRESPIVWIGDLCYAPNRRERYIHELMRHIGVDSYGKCLHNKDWPEGKSWEEVVSGYKFFLAFEHENCKDYVTEQYWKAIQLGVVPIVMGAPNIDDFAPSPHSVIKTIDYSGPQQLAEHLHRINNNDELYLEYLSHKYNKSLLNPRFSYYLQKFHYKDPWCELCYLLQEPYQKRAFRPDFTCQNKWAILKQIRQGSVQQADGEKEEDEG
eukprot:TRINITY_DN5403_c0_g1_i1.p1 TRINITY_DN5403_c0_g1~~TRINITY_DN5403_c0_g1_i1.p1  ORF type:complete len:404 (+),score=70.60 TRINITY_DN5403_c0_g1_i1:53-1264(+)